MKEQTMDENNVLQTAVSSDAEDITAEHIVGKIKRPVGAVPMITPGLPPIMLKKQREREERMEEMKREAKLAEEQVVGEKVPLSEMEVEDTSPTTDKSIDDALLSRPTVTGGKRRPRMKSGGEL